MGNKNKKKTGACVLSPREKARKLGNTVFLVWVSFYTDAATRALRRRLRGSPYKSLIISKTRNSQSGGTSFGSVVA